MVKFLLEVEDYDKSLYGVSNVITLLSLAKQVISTHLCKITICCCSHQIRESVDSLDVGMAPTRNICNT